MSWCPSFLAAVLLAAVSAGFDAQAADWTWGGSLSGRVEHISNATLAVPAGNRLAFHYDAVGVQITACPITAERVYEALQSQV